MMQKSTNGWLNKDDFISKIDLFNDTFTTGKNIKKVLDEIKPFTYLLKIHYLKYIKFF